MMPSERLLVSFFVLVLVSLPSSTHSVGSVVAAEEASITANVHDVPSWPQFRGRNGLGVANKGQYVTEFGLDQNLVWKTEIDAGVSSPCIWGNHILLTCFDASTERLSTICVNRRDGQVRWRRELRADQIEEVHEVSSPANSTPATDGKRFYVYFASYGLVCYDFEGREIWTRKLPLREIDFGNGASPIVVSGMVVLNLDDGGKWIQDSDGNWLQHDVTAHLLAVCCDDGRTVWDIQRLKNGLRYATPAVWKNKEGGQVILFGMSRVDGYDLATGAHVWWVEGLPMKSCTTPQMLPDRVIVMATGMYGETETYVAPPSFEEFLKAHDGDENGKLSLSEIPQAELLVNRQTSDGVGNERLNEYTEHADENKDGNISKEEWNSFRAEANKYIAAPSGLYSIRLDGKGDVSDTHIEWRETKGVAEISTPLVYDDRLYLVRNGGIVYCRDVADGHQIFRGRLGPTGGYYASPVAGDGKVYFASDRGTVTVIASGDSLKVLAKNDLGERIMATPALVDGRIYIRSDKHLFAFGQ